MSIYGPEYLQSKSKRALDVVGGLALATTLLPVGLAAAAAAGYDNRSLNPFFNQLRQDGRGNHVSITKFRTLPKQPVSVAVITHGTFDPRASRIGRVLRQSGLDELPQLVNIISGDISLVGIRPATDAALERMETADAHLFDEWNEARKDIPLGLTGLSQIYRHYQRQVSPKVDITAMELDIQYGETASLRQDFAIIGRTPIELVRASIQQPLAQKDIPWLNAAA